MVRKNKMRKALMKKALVAQMALDCYPPKIQRRQPRRRRRVRRAGLLPLARATEIGFSSIGPNRKILTGTDFFGTVKLPSTLTVDNSVLFQLPASPSAWPGTRAQIQALTFEKYRFTKLQIVYEPSCAGTVGGQVIGFFDLDPTDDFTGALSTAQMVRSALAHQNSKLFNVNSPHVIDLLIRPGLTDFFTGTPVGDVKLYQQAKFWIIAVAGISGTGLPADNNVGSLFLHYTIEFEGEQLLPSSEPGPSDAVISDALSAVIPQTGSGTFAFPAFPAGSGDPWVLGDVPVSVYPTTNAVGVYEASAPGSTMTFLPFINSGLLPTPSAIYIVASNGGSNFFTAIRCASSTLAGVQFEQAANSSATTGALLPSTDDVDTLVNNLQPAPSSFSTPMMKDLIGKINALNLKFDRLHSRRQLRRATVQPEVLVPKQ